MKSIIVSFVFLLFSSQIFAECQYTSEYQEARDEAVEVMAEKRSACIQAAKDYAYWKLMETCYKTARDVSSLNNCETIATRKNKSLNKSQLAHCEVFQPDLKLFQQYLEQMVTDLGIKKCRP